MGFVAVGDKMIADTTPDLSPFALAQDVSDEFENVVYKEKIATAINNESTDEQVASAKAVYTELELKPEIDDDDTTSLITTFSGKHISDVIGDLTTLVTENNDSLVEAINETNDNIGDLAELKTTEKGSVVGAVNELNDSLVDIEDDLGELDKKVTFEGGVSKTRFGVDNGVAYSDIVDGTETHRLVMSKDEQRLAYNHYTGTTLDKAFELATMDKVDSELKKVTKIETKYIGTSGEFQLANGVYLLTYTQFGAQNCYGMYTVFVSNYAPTTKVVKVFDSGEYPITATIDATSKKISITCATTIQVGLCSICPIVS